jgi:uncharacterized protein YbjT (DUF2867 family)
MVLVVGATGHVGSTVCRLLRDNGTPVRALVRATSDPDKVRALRDVGVSIVTGDLREPASLVAALNGVDAVVSTATATSAPAADNTVTNVDGDGQLALVDAARQAGVGHFVFVSYSGNIEVDIPLRTAKRGVEKRLRESGVPFTILRPSLFMEVWLSPMVGFDPAGGSVLVFGTGEQRLSFISAGDVARFCAAIIDQGEARNRTIELGGPAAVSPHDVVAIAEKITGRSIPVQHVPAEALRAQYDAATDPLQRTMTGLTYAVTEGDVIDMSATLQEFPIRLRTVREHLQQLIEATKSTAGTPDAQSGG